VTPPVIRYCYYANPSIIKSVSLLYEKLFGEAPDPSFRWANENRDNAQYKKRGSLGAKAL
jgi:hypothetical protein